MRPFTPTAALIIALAVILAGASSEALGQAVPDADLTRRLEAAIERDLRLRQAEIQVSVTNGSVALKGTVASYVAKVQAEQIAKRMAGVQAVNNWLIVDSDLRRDPEIEHDVRARFQLSQGLKPAMVSIQVKDGTVTLSGKVPTWSQLRWAELVAGEVRGVRHVHNDLVLDLDPRVSAASRNDELIETEVRAAIRLDAYIGYLPIDVHVQSGVVRLDGEVPNLFHSDRASLQASEVLGVRSVDNRLQVESQLLLEMLPVRPSDEEHRQALLDELRLYPQLDGAGVEVAVSNGLVTLSGKAASLFEKKTFGRIARTMIGVVRVDNRLLVDSAGRSDAEILADAQFSLRSDSLLEPQPVRVAVSDGTVTLSGDAHDLSSKLHAAQLVARINGVRAIENLIVVKWNSSTGDDLLRSAIEEQLAASLVTRRVATRIRVVVSEGRVTLVGSVDHTAELIEAGRIARLADAVRSVSNKLDVRR